MRITPFLVLAAALPLWHRPPACGAQPVETVIASQEPRLAALDDSAREYLRLQIDNQVSYFHQRMSGEAIVEKDYIRYQFDTDTGELLEETIFWRDDVPDTVTPRVSQAEAEALVAGEVEMSQLFIISPESDVFPLKPTPANPCWAVRSWVGRALVVTVIDAVSGERLGYGLAPPTVTGYSLAGPDWGSCPVYYDTYAQNAEAWFEDMGYDTEYAPIPSDASVQGAIQSDNIAMFYELAHGGSWDFHHHCPDSENIDAGEIQTWMTGFAHMPFTFLGSCDGMCDQTDNHLSFEFRRGQTDDTVAVGYCGMSSPGCAACWGSAMNWQTTLFDWMSDGWTVQTAFNQANLAFPTCVAGNCTRIAGDTNMSFVPVIRRSICGTVYDGAGGPLTHNASRATFVRCDVSVPYGQTLSVDSFGTVAFLNNAKFWAAGTLRVYFDVRLVSATNRTKGLRTTGTGQLRAQGGGQVRVYE